MQQKELIQTVSNITSVSRSIVAEILKTTACVVAETLAEGEETEVKVPGFGIFSTHVSATRVMRLNLQEVQEIRMVGGRKRPRFRPSKPFAECIDGGRKI